MDSHVRCVYARSSVDRLGAADVDHFYSGIIVSMRVLPDRDETGYFPSDQV